jgi:hypothetical protein
VSRWRDHSCGAGRRAEHWYQNIQGQQAAGRTQQEICSRQQATGSRQHAAGRQAGSHPARCSKQPAGSPQRSTHLAVGGQPVGGAHALPAQHGARFQPLKQLVVEDLVGGLQGRAAGHATKVTNKVNKDYKQMSRK